jgi:hypothetical protein
LATKLTSGVKFTTKQGNSNAAINALQISRRGACLRLNKKVKAKPNTANHIEKSIAALSQ